MATNIVVETAARLIIHVQFWIIMY